MKKLSMLSAAVSAFALLAGGATPALAQGSFPQREVTIVVPFNPGGASDMTARIIAKGMEPELGKPVVDCRARHAGCSCAGGYAVVDQDLAAFLLIVGKPNDETANVNLRRD